jgi:hypothetical protein
MNLQIIGFQNLLELTQDLVVLRDPWFFLMICICIWSLIPLTTWVKHLPRLYCEIHLFVTWNIIMYKMLFCRVGGFGRLDIYIYDGKQEAIQPSEEAHDLSTQQPYRQMVG